MRNIRARQSITIALVTLLAASAGVLLTGCDGGGGGSDIPSNSSTLMGTVDSFASGGAFFIPEESPTGLAAVWAGIHDLLEPSAFAAAPGVTVEVAGISTSTADDGLFVIAGIPPGTQDVIFSMNGESGALSVDIPAHATVELRGVSVSDGRVGVRGMQVVIHEDEDSVSADDDSDDVSSDDDSDDISEDDTSDDDDESSSYRA